ncbi:GNAT family N-acetyltransferase [Oceanirhabdus seepicola]|uniref:GNAT family N-acetyltransferase n=1 Tax=Oceanirhabdus seepicola TaxID=2828781 RepID=A0A9J6P8K6_9CLOT|nr:GNAT family N-acetyltransferase [Oceanirhabdus seepicola]MCM1991877.1 GNAT family N-acetyltransferase [Oceanirhabdus seepicola]
MEYKRYKKVEEFLGECKGFLMEKEVENNLFLGICNDIIIGAREYEEVYCGSVKKEGEIKLIALMTVPHNLLIDSRDDESLEYFLDKMYKENLTIPGTNGRKETSKKAIEYFSEKYNKEYECAMNLRVYELTKVKDVSIPNGHFEMATMKYHELITRWMYDATIDFGMKVEGNPLSEERLNRAEFLIKNKKVYIWIDEAGKPVTTAMRMKKTDHGEVVGMVYTPKEFRRNGYATACVKVVSEEILKEGNRFAALFTDLANPISNSIYMKMGYEPICDYDQYEFEK